MSVQLEITPTIDDTAPELLPWRMGQATHCGQYHSQNEDRVCAIATPSGYFVAVADGVGGGVHGDVAAQQMIDHCRQLPFPSSANALKAHLIAGDAQVTAALQALSNQKGACGFAAAWLNTQGRGWLTWVGDVRIYLASVQASGVLITQLSMDQTFANLGEQPATAKPHDPARLVGFGKIGDPEVCSVVLQPHQALLVMSDGVHRFLPHSVLVECAQPLHDPQTDLGQLAQHWVNSALQQHSHDDCSIAIIQHLLTVPPVPQVSILATPTPQAPHPPAPIALPSWRTRSIWSYIFVLIGLFVLGLCVGGYYGRYF